MKTHDYIHHYRGYWDDGGVCRIRICEDEYREPVVICSELPENTNTSVTNMAEYISAEVIVEYGLPTPFIWIEHYPRDESQRRAGLREEWDLVAFSDYEVRETHGSGKRRVRIGTPEWKHLSRASVEEMVGETLDAWEASVPSVGNCRTCGRVLSNPASVERGIGPVCASREALSQDTDEADEFSDRFLAEPDYREEILLVRDGERVYTNVPHLITHHSPDGYEWGHGGSGPADLALNIVEAALRDLGHDGENIECWRGGCFREAWRLHQDFKRRFLADMPRSGGVISWEDVAGWVRTNAVLRDGVERDSGNGASSSTVVERRTRSPAREEA